MPHPYVAKKDLMINIIEFHTDIESGGDTEAREKRKKKNKARRDKGRDNEGELEEDSWDITYGLLPPHKDFRPKSFDEIKEVVLEDKGAFRYIKLQIYEKKTKRKKIVIRGFKNVINHCMLLSKF